MKTDIWGWMLEAVRDTALTAEQEIRLRVFEALAIHSAGRPISGLIASMHEAAAAIEFGVDGLDDEAFNVEIFDEVCAKARRERAEALAEAEQLRYERRLLGFARRVLDLVAGGDEQGYDAAYIRTQAEDLAQRIVDEIGHPVTDEPALGPSYRERVALLERQRDAVLALAAAAENRPGASNWTWVRATDLREVYNDPETAPASTENDYVIPIHLEEW